MLVRSPVLLAGKQLDHFHVAAFFRNVEEEDQVVIPYTLDGLDGGERIIHICSAADVESHRERFRAAGIDVEALEASGQILLLTWAETYLADGRFERQRMMDTLAAVVEESGKLGYSGTRFVGHMEWILGSPPGVEDVLRYESEVTEVLDRLEQPAICAYDATRYSGDHLIDIIRTHPAVIFGTVLQTNPFWIDPTVAEAALVS